jgi:hypothetical protein
MALLTDADNATTVEADHTTLVSQDKSQTLLAPSEPSLSSTSSISKGKRRRNDPATDAEVDDGLQRLTTGNNTSLRGLRKAVLVTLCALKFKKGVTHQVGAGVVEENISDGRGNNGMSIDEEYNYNNDNVEVLLDRLKQWVSCIPFPTRYVRGPCN